MRFYPKDIPDGQEIYLDHGVAYILPLHEGPPAWVKRIGQYGVGVSYRLSSWSVGFDILKHGLLVQIGPAFLFCAHIRKQLAHFTPPAIEGMER